MYYRCVHCLTILGLLADGEPTPCEAHPDGQIDVIAGDEE
jgi:hypothetical protein